MNKNIERKCTKIVIRSHSGHFNLSPWQSKLAINRSTITFNKKTIAFSKNPRRVLQWKKYLDEEDLKFVDEAFEFANKIHFPEDYNMVCDGQGPETILYFDNKTKEAFYTTYGNCIDESYGEIYTLLKLISPLVDNDRVRLGYFEFE